mmetsp:Transcript_172/g.426  ORF Transcript_172/g.426 Transcript_172/m.426 type:complete len:296 (+) Transcript_172:68-955(+)
MQGVRSNHGACRVAAATAVLAAVAPGAVAAKMGRWSGSLRVGANVPFTFLRNHTARDLMINADDAPMAAPPGFLRFTSHCYAPEFTPGKDVCVLLEPKVVGVCPPKNVSAADKYTVTFKGSVLLSDPGMIRMNLFGLTNERLGVYIVARCSHFIRRIHPGDAPRLTMCYRTALDWEAFDYCDLLRYTTYSLVPEGKQPASYRFLEVLCLGAIPIVYTNKSAVYWPFPASIPDHEWLACVHVVRQPYQITLLAWKHHNNGGADAAARRPACKRLREAVCTVRQRQQLYIKELQSLP